jgi:hypothetical protein
MRLRRLQAPVRLRPADQWVPFGVRDRFDSQIDIERWPVQMMRTGQLNAGELGDRSILEPGELLERHKEFLLADEQPESMW